MIVLTDGRAQDNVAGPAVIAQERTFDFFIETIDYFSEWVHGFFS